MKSYIIERLKACLPHIGHNPFDEKSFQFVYEKLCEKNFEREKLVSTLNEFNENLSPSDKTRSNIEALRSNDTVCVVTGQQTGLFTGPLYTIYKALTCIRLADHLSRIGIKAIPIFWLPSEDRDFEEISSINILNKDNALVKISSTIETDENGFFTYGKGMKETIEKTFDELTNSEFKGEIMSALLKLYDSGKTPHESFARFMNFIFRGKGLVFAAQHLEAFKEMGAGIIKKEMETFSKSSELVRKKNEKLIKNGLSPQIKLSKNALNLFCLDNSRKTIFVEEENFLIDGEKYSLEKLLNEPLKNFSPNVLLRPIFEDSILPTISYVAGPSEISYYAQLKDVYEFFGITMPVVFPRVNVLLLERRNKTLLENYGLELKDLSEGRDRISKRIIMEKEGIFKSFAHIEEDFENIIQPFEDEIARFDITLKDAVYKVKGHFMTDISNLRQKVYGLQKSKESTTAKQIERLCNSLLPFGCEQEREVNILPFLVKYGPEIIETIDSGVDIFAEEKQTVEL